MDDFFVLQKMWEDSRGDFLNEIKNTNVCAILDSLIPLKMGSGQLVVQIVTII